MFGQYCDNGGKRLRVRDVARWAPGTVKGAGHNRFIITLPGGERRYRLYETDVVTVLSDGTVILDDGGHPTMTTRRAIGQGIKTLLGADVTCWARGKDGGHVVCQRGYGPVVAEFKGRAVYAPGHFDFSA